MKAQESIRKSQGRTFLKSISHLRVNEIERNYLRSIIVGLQFFLFLPSELITVVFWPFIRNVVLEIYAALDSFFFVILGAFSVIISGFSGYLEASYEPIIDDEDDLI